MDLNLLREKALRRPGGIKRLAADIGMSEANFHRCIKTGSIKAEDLEQAAILLGEDVAQFFDPEAVVLSPDERKPVTQADELLQLCQNIVGNRREYDQLMARLTTLLHSIERQQ